MARSGENKKRTSRSNGADNNPVRNSIADENPMKLGGGGRKNDVEDSVKKNGSDEVGVAYGDAKRRVEPLR